MSFKIQNNAETRDNQVRGKIRSQDSVEGHSRTDEHDQTRRTADKKPGPDGPQPQPTPEDFGERGMGIAAKE